MRTWAPQDGELTALLRAESLAIFAFSPASICCGLFSGAGTNIFDSFSNEAYDETCKNFNFNLLLNFPN